ncbi:hypothetical protein ACTXT7_004437 [Hymenolepis weldensis]
MQAFEHSQIENTMSNYPFEQTRQEHVVQQLQRRRWFAKFHKAIQISYFGLFPDKDASVRTFDKLAVTISDFWSDFQPHWKIKLSVIPDPDLRYCEMARWKVTMVAEDKSEFELASVSLLGDWVSRRGDIKSSSNGVHLFMVFGEMVNLENFIAAVGKEGAFQPASE